MILFGQVSLGVLLFVPLGAAPLYLYYAARLPLLMGKARYSWPPH
jgi:hypothetical protein